uniref:Putative lipocalin n=1 Tax=Rhipicephalus microplus TaxID=6941 RepID=A0A6G5A5S1_RHIMP
MADFTALVLLTLVSTSMTVRIYNPFDSIDVDLSSFQDPWPIINDTRDVYLGRVSIENATFDCVKSQFFTYEWCNKTVDRSLDFGTLNESSLNISLNVKYEKSHNQSNLTTLEVTSMAQREILLLNKSYTIGNNTFRVLYGDRTCLILGNEIIKRGKNMRLRKRWGFTNCTLWFPYTSGYLSPPTCCEFLLVVLCGQNSKVVSRKCHDLRRKVESH